MMKEFGDKSKWGNGPWQSEPDEKRWKDWETGYQCLALRGPVGAWCGYVGVPLNHLAAGKSCHRTDFDIDEIINDGAREKALIQKKINDILVHGGLTYAGADAQRSKDFYWFGFDCAHCDDWAPSFIVYASADYLKHCGPGVKTQWGAVISYRDLPYVERECASLAKQLRAIEP